MGLGKTHTPEGGKDPRHRIPLRRIAVCWGIAGKTLERLLKELSRAAENKDA